MKTSQLKRKIKQIQDYLGPRVNYNSDYIQCDYIPERWLLEYLDILKEMYYGGIRKRKKKSQGG